MKKIIFFIIAAATLGSCSKGYLDAKPDKKLVVPSTLPDLQAMLDNTTFVFNNNQPALGEVGSDDYYLQYDDWLAQYTNTERNAYIWAKEIYNGESVSDWMSPYQRVFYENYILETLTSIPKDTTNTASWNNIEGSAFFGRAFDFFSLADIFTLPFDSVTAGKELGIPLRLHSDINEKVGRSTISETFTQIIADANASLQYLPSLPAFKTRPSKAAAYALLARIYLTMGNFNKALDYADSSLGLQSILMDYNTLDPTAPFPFTVLNDEVVYHTALYYFNILSQGSAIVDSSLYSSYDVNDLRRYLFVDTTSGLPRFKGGYDGYVGFGGIATDEVYLISAECNARIGKVTEAMQRLNDLLVTRWATGTYVPLSAATADDALRLILAERRKELLFRGTRWTDLRRLNKDSRFAVTLTRNLNGQIYTLPPNDNRYAYPIPDQEIQVTGIPQNPR